jgi:hypothetical protein
MFQMLQMMQQENMMLKAQLGIAPMPGNADSSASLRSAQNDLGAGGNAKLPQTDSQGGVVKQNRIADKAKAQAQAATQPG